jgi:hypothetical protein
MVRSREIEQLKQHLHLTEEQREALVGLLLGDAHLETQNHGRTYRLKIEQSEAHRAYVEHLYRLFESWVLTPPQPKQRDSRGHVSTNWWFQTVSHGAFRFYAQQFYREGRKCVPKLIHRWLTPRGLAYWFMDDGSLKWEKSRVVLFNTQGFDQTDVQRLIRAVEQQFAVEAYLRRQPEGFQIAIAGRSLERFVRLIGPFLLPEMTYKLPEAGRTYLPKR